MTSPIFGRAGLLAAASAELGRADSAGIVLCGPAGVGKTFAAERIVEALDAPVWRVYGTASDVPLGALAPYLPPGLADGGLAPTIVLKRLLANDDEATVVLVDDAPSLDAHSAEALMHAADSGHVRLVLTQRTSTMLPEAFDWLVRKSAIARFDVTELDATAAGELACHLAGGPLVDRSRATIHRLTVGNPLYVRELLRAAVDEERLVATAAGLELDGVPASSGRLADLVERRLDGLDADARSALTTLAVAEPLGPGELASIVDERAIHRLDDAGHLSISLDNRRLRIRLSHPLHGEVLRAGTSPLTLRTIRAQVAERIAEFGARRRDDRLRMAMWALDGGVDAGAEIFHEAARTAFIAGDAALSARLAEAAFERSPDFDVGWTVDVARYELGEPTALIAHYERWAPLIRDEADRAVFMQARANGRFWRLGDLGGLHQLLDEIDQLAGDPRAEVTATASALLAVHGNVNRAVDLAAEVLAGEPSRSTLFAALATAHGVRAQGRPAEAAEVASTAIDVARSIGSEAFIVSDAILGSARAHALAEAGDLDDAERVAAETATIGQDIGSASAVGLAHLAGGWVELLRGRPEAAVPLFEASTSATEQARHPGMVRWARMALALAHALAGDADAASEEIAAVDAAGPHPAAIFDATLARARAWTAHAHGFPEDAVAHLIGGFEGAVRRGNVTDALMCLHDLARLGRARDALERLDSVTARLDGRVLPAMRRQIVAMARNDLDLLEAGVEELEHIGLFRFAIDGADAAASISSKDHDGHLVNTWLRRAAELRANVGGRSAAEPEVPATLTRREREVALLASRGLANRDIADRLYVSPRTVESHLARIYDKLGLSGRAELAALLRG